MNNISGTSLKKAFGGRSFYFFTAKYNTNVIIASPSGRYSIKKIIIKLKFSLNTLLVTFKA